MASLVVVRFGDDAAARRFAAFVNRGGVAVGDGEWVVDTYAEGLYRTPTMFCDCDVAKRGWSWEDHHGWVVHPGCGKPSDGWGHNHRAVIGMAKNHLELPSANSNELYVKDMYHPTEVVKNRGLLE